MAKLILFNKPFDVLCQFTDDSGRKTLADYLTSPQCRDCYPAGRLDRDSEGLLLLTDDGRLQQQIANPQFKLPKTYWVQVEGEPAPAALDQLRAGVTLNDGATRPALVETMTPPTIWVREPPIRQRATIPTHWLRITITEGRNRQVRRMTAAVGLPTLRLIRARIGPWQLEHLQPGEYQIQKVHPERKPSARRSSSRTGRT